MIQGRIVAMRNVPREELFEFTAGERLNPLDELRDCSFRRDLAAAGTRLGSGPGVRA